MAAGTLSLSSKHNQTSSGPLVPGVDRRQKMLRLFDDPCAPATGETESVISSTVSLIPDVLASILEF